MEVLEQSAQDLEQELSLGKEKSSSTSSDEVKQLRDNLSQLQEENHSVTDLLEKSEKYK